MYQKKTSTKIGYNERENVIPKQQQQGNSFTYKIGKLKRDFGGDVVMDAINKDKINFLFIDDEGNALERSFKLELCCHNLLHLNNKYLSALQINN